MRLLLSLLLCLLPLLACADDWQLRREDGVRNIRVYLRDRDGSPYQAVYAVTRLPASVRQVEAVLSDFSAMPEWAPHLISARLLRQQGNQAWIHVRYHLPYPFRQRDVVIRSQRSKSDEGVVSIHSNAVPGLLAANVSSIRLQHVQNTWRITPLPSGEVKIEFWATAEPGGLVPAVLFNYNLAEDSLQSLRQLRRMLQRAKYQDHPQPAVHSDTTTVGRVTNSVSDKSRYPAVALGSGTHL